MRRSEVTFKTGGADRKGRNKKLVDPKVRARADELHKMGLPYQMAMAVAHKKLDLNVALERMARKDQVTKLMERHDLSRALATQITIGHADLRQVLARRRLEAHRAENRDRSCLTSPEPLAYALTGHTLVTGTVESVGVYLVSLRDAKAGTAEEVHKLRFKYAYRPDDWKSVRKALKKGKGKDPVEPAARPQDRYSCSDRRVFTFMDQEVDVNAALLEGDLLRGRINWFGRYEFGLKIKGDAEITVFRHALENLTEA